MYMKNLKLLLKTVRLIVPIIAILVYLFYIIYRIIVAFTRYVDPISTFRLSFEISVTLFFLLLYLSYEFTFLIKKSNIIESIMEKKKKVYKSVAILLLTIPIIIVLVLLALNLFSIFRSYYFDYLFVFHVFLTLILYIFLPSAIAIFMGITLALKCNRIVSLSLIGLFLFIMLPVSDFIPGLATQRTYVDFWQIKYFFSRILPSGQNSLLFRNYGYSNELYRWNLNLFWLFLFIAFFIFAIFKRKKLKYYVLKTICLLLCVVNLFGYFLGGSYIEDGASLNATHMNNYVHFKTHTVKEEKADFNIKSYEMDLNIGRQLDANVTMKLTPSESNNYIFTLFRDYEIKEIKDENGNNIPYSVDGDYFKLEATDLEYVHIKYSGWYTETPSNYQSTTLPSIFPYYPMAGYHEIVGTQGGIIPVEQDYKSDFDVKVNTIKQMYSNIEETQDKNHFKGTAKGLLLFSGFYVDTSSDGYNILSLSVQSYDSVSLLTPKGIQKLQESINEFEKENNIEPHFELKDYNIISSGYISNLNFVYQNDFVEYYEDFIFILLDDNLILNNEEFLKDATKIALASFDNNYHLEKDGGMYVLQ